MLRDVLLDRSLSGKRRERGALVSTQLGLALTRDDICSCFSENKFACPSTEYVRTFLLRPCGADRRMRFSRAPAYPSRDYLGRESSSLPRSFPSLLPIRGGARFSSSRGSRDEPHSRRPRTAVALRKVAECHIRIIHTYTYI